MTTFVISQQTVDKCFKFAKESVSSSEDKYANRNQFDIDKIIKDIRNGKIAEEQTFLHLKNKYNSLTKPDYNIYDKYNKNWDPDLKCNEFKLAVKSQDYDSALIFGTSWVFQFNNNNSFDCDKQIFKTSEEDDKKHFVSFVSLSVPFRKGEFKAFVSVNWLKKNNLFKEMKKKSLRGNKVAVYYEDIQKFENIWQI